MEIPFAVHAYRHRVLPIAAQRCVNFYAEQQPPDAKTKAAVLGVPGITLFNNLGSAPIRALRVVDGLLYVLRGSALYSVDSDGAETLIGNIFTSTGFVSTAVNSNNELCIVDGLHGWVYSAALGLQQITADAFDPADTVTFQDGYFIFNRKGTGEFFISGLNDGLSFSGTDVATAEGSPDDIRAVISNHRELWLLGHETTEVWYNSGALDFPFERNPGAFIEQGCAAAGSVVALDNSVIWLADDFTVRRADGYVPMRISTHAIEAEIQKYSDVSDAVALTYTDEGHKFYVITFPAGGATFAFDAATQLWHERDSRDGDGDSLGRWRVNAYADAYGKRMVGDVTGRVGFLDHDAHDEFGFTVRGLLAGPPIHRDRKNIAMSRFEVDIESGVGLNSGQGSDPQAQLDWSDDGGHTWTDLKPWSGMGKIGQYRHRFVWRRMGQFRERILRLEVTDPVRRAVVRAHTEIDFSET
jgi:hypothetical protein